MTIEAGRQVHGELIILFLLLCVIKNYTNKKFKKNLVNAANQGSLDK